MIIGFACKETERIWFGEGSRKLPSNIQKVARRKLRMVNSAASLDDLRIPPSNRLELLKGNLKGFYSIRINDQFRLCFAWHEGQASDVKIMDYH